MSGTIRVLIAEDHPLMRSGICSTLTQEDDIEVVGEADNGLQTIKIALQTQPDIVVLDLSMPGMHFLETINQLKRRLEKTSVLVLTAYDDSQFVRGVAKAGVAGYLLKHEVPEALVNALRTVYQGGNWFSRTAFARLHEISAEGNALADLTDRDRSVLDLIAAGKNNKQIAKQLSIAEQTVRNYVSRIYSKVGVHSRVELVVWARDHYLSSV
jgi:DNA-binding NarL/FixJ family response regulator